MYGSTTKWMAGLAVAMVALVGCGNEQCDAFGEHLADIAIKEAKEAGGEVAEDKRAEIVKKTVSACNAEPPKKAALECAMKATSTKDMKKCEGVDEDAENEEG